MHKNIGKFVFDSFMSPHDYYWEKVKEDGRPNIDFKFWSKSWNEDLHIIWFHIYRWYFCITWKNYFLRYVNIDWSDIDEIRNKYKKSKENDRI